MGKFKVGQKVRFKSKEELKKIAFFDEWKPKYKALAGKIVKICEKGSENYYIIQNGQEILYLLFPECYFEDVDTLVEI